MTGCRTAVADALDDLLDAARGSEDPPFTEDQLDFLAEAAGDIHARFRPEAAPLVLDQRPIDLRTARHYITAALSMGDAERHATAAGDAALHGHTGRAADAVWEVRRIVAEAFAAYDAIDRILAGSADD